MRMKAHPLRDHSFHSPSLSWVWIAVPDSTLTSRHERNRRPKQSAFPDASRRRFRSANTGFSFCDDLRTRRGRFWLPSRPGTRPVRLFCFRDAARTFFFSLMTALSEMPQHHLSNARPNCISAHAYVEQVSFSLESRLLLKASRERKAE